MRNEYDDLDEIIDNEEISWCAYCKEEIYADDTVVHHEGKDYHIGCYETEFGDYDPEDSDWTDPEVMNNIIDDDYGPEENYCD